jgi:hypothetical protein
VEAVQAAWTSETPQVDDAKVRALSRLTERGLIKSKRAMPFVQLFKVRCNSHPLFFLSILILILILTFDVGVLAHSSTYTVETDCPIWQRDGVQAEAAIRSDGCAA